MKRFTSIRTLAVLLMASAALVSCSFNKEIFEKDTTPEEDPAVQPAKVYNLSVSASKGGDDATKALSLDGKTLNATWTEGDEVTVYNKTRLAKLDGTLIAQSSGASTELKGSLRGTIENGDELILSYNNADYASQDGTLDYIAHNCDYAQAVVTVSRIDGADIVIESTATFENQQAIVKFILKDKEGNNLNVSRLTISAESQRLVSASSIRGCGTKTYHTGYTVDGGSGSTGGEGYDKLLDGNTGTKWCSKVKSDGVWYVEFHTASAVQVDGYKLTTGNDTQSYSGRNPKNWTLKAKVNIDDAWTVIDTKTDNTDMPAANFSSVDFEADVQGIYQYFRLEVSAIQSGESFQLSEMQLYGCPYREFSIQYGNVNVLPADAASELTFALNNQSGASDTYIFTAHSGNYDYYFTKSGVTFESGKYYVITMKMSRQTLPEGAVDGKFTVSSDKQVYFSKGNLQATYDGSKWSWAFANHQYDILGFDSGVIIDKGTINGPGSVELFGWSTPVTSYGIYKSMYRFDYSGNLVDWGKTIDGSGNTWRTLASDEWGYLFNNRTAGGTVFGTSSARYTFATVNTDVSGANGIILFPDGVDIETSEVTTAGTVNGTSSFSTKCTSSQWTALEAKGCVFLPAAGSRDQTNLRDINVNGYYWSASVNPVADQGQHRPYFVYFASNNLAISCSDHCEPFGHSVRLVTTVELVMEMEIEVLVSDSLNPMDNPENL